MLETESEQIPEEIKALAQERKEAKADKDYARADEIRKIIAEKNYVIEDIPGGDYRIKQKEKN